MPCGRIVLMLSLLVMLGAATALVAYADASPEIVIYGGDGDVPVAGYLPPATAGNIMIGGTPVLEIPGNGGGVVLAVRAEIVDTRLVEILSSGIVGPVWVGAVRGKPTVYVGDFRLITAYPEDAAATDCTMRELASQWAEGVAWAVLRTSPAVGPTPEEAGTAELVPVTP